MAPASMGDVAKKERALLWHGSLISNNVVKSALKISMTERARTAACAAAPPSFAAAGIHKHTKHEHLSLLLITDTIHIHPLINC
jgi:hypothetical protein